MADIDEVLPSDLATMLASRQLDLRRFRLSLVEQLKIVAPLDQLVFGDRLIEQILRLPSEVATRQHHDAAFLVLKFQKRWSEFETLLERLPADAPLGPAARLAVVQSREKMGHFDDARSFAQESVGLFPGSRALHRRLYKLLRITDRAGEADQVFAQLAANFDVEDVVSAIAGLKGVRLPPTEIDFLIKQLPTTGDEQLPKLTLTLASAQLSDDQLASLTTMLDALDETTGTKLRIILATAQDEADLTQINTEPMSVQRFEARRDAIALSEDVLVRQLSQGSQELPRRVQALASASARAALYTRESYSDALKLALELRRRIATGTPTLLTRVGDGEGAFMRGYRPNPSAKDMSEHGSRQVIWWGEQAAPDRATDLATNYRDALNAADIIGVPPPWRVRQPFNGAGGHEMRENLGHSLQLVDDHSQVGSAWITSAHANTDLEKWNLWRLVLNATDSVNFVACHDLEQPLDAQFSVVTGTKIVVPGVHRFAEVFGANLGLDGSNLLDHHDRVCDAIHARPEGVWLIAAGFLGKYYGALVRGGGGIAIDIGALADYWAGYTTRDFSGEAAVHHLPSSLASDVHVDWNNKPAPTKEDDERVRSNLYFDGFCNSEQPPSQSTVDELSFKIIGHPRCASGHVSKVFETLGYEVGHERLRADGITSWMLTVDDAHVPWGDVPSADQEFGHVLGYVRDPFEAIPSIILENGAHDSFMFRRLHILRNFDVDIGLYKTPLERACASLVYWDLLAREQLTGPTIRIEHARSDVEAFLSTANLPASETSASIEDDVRYNSSFQKHGVEKQALSATALSRVDPVLVGLVEDYCAKYGYAFIRS